MPAGREQQGGRRGRGTRTSARRSERARSAQSGGQRSTRPRPGTGGAFKLSSTRRAAVLAILVCAMALSVSVPLRTYMSQRDELQAKQQQQAELAEDVRELTKRKDRLSDPQHVEAEARRRLGLVRPGETPYVVHLPPDKKPEKPEPAPKPKGVPWYQQLWQSLTGGGS